MRESDAGRVKVLGVSRRVFGLRQCHLVLAKRERVGMIRNPRKLVFLLPLVMGLPACASETASTDNGIVEGRVSLGPTMPVCLQGVPCDGVYAGAKIIVRLQGGEAVAHAVTNQQGKFRVDLAAGKYIVGVETEAALPRCSEAQVIIAAGVTVRADIDCDTGIR